jgi:hypothetical protein
MAAEPTRGGGGASNPPVALAFKEVAPRKGARGYARGRPLLWWPWATDGPTVSGTAPTASARDFRLAALDDLADTLCHYTTADAAFGHIVPSGELRMSPYARMRDPLENRELPFGGGASGDETEAHVKLMDRIVAAIRNVRDATRLLSFTVDAREGSTDSDLPFMRAWARARMWEQYASNHAGICIAFDRERALGHINANLHEMGVVSSGEVVYSARGFRGTSASTLMLDQFSEDRIAADVASFVVGHDHDLFFTKTLDSQSEHEFRVTLMTNVEGEEAEFVHVLFGDAVSVRAVILGEQFPEWQFPAAKWACEQVGVPLLTLRWEVGLPWPMPTS